jgi:AcrR family transcriptional regulator
MAAVSPRTRDVAAPRANGAPAEIALAARPGTLGRERVGEIQRARILAAMTELVRERGVAGVTVAQVVNRSGVSRRTFYELFEDRDDCLLAAFEQGVARAAATVLPAYDGAGSIWEERIRAGLMALLEFLDAEPAPGGLCVVDSLAAERPLLERRARVVGALVDAVQRGGTRPRPARIVAEGTVGAVLAVIHARLYESDPQPLVGLLNQLMSIVVLPYLGPEAAERERKRPAPRTRRRPTPLGDPLRELDMRLTYRTVRVLLAIADLGVSGSPPSSREVSDAAGVADQGQISKLLWRLEHLGLIANRTQHHGRGEPNAWTLTAKGEDVARAIRAQTEG